MLQYYLRAEGLALSWVGTGRLIFSLNYTDADFDAVADRFVAAAEGDAARRLVVDAMPAVTNKSIKRQHPARDDRTPAAVAPPHAKPLTGERGPGCSSSRRSPCCA